VTELDVRVGLEIHAYLATDAKLYCRCPARFLEADPNTHVCPVCTGQPGSKPMAVNREAAGLAVRVADALGCRLADEVEVLRKHYFYPDLPVNYQRTTEPVGEDGELAGVGIEEVHLEEDPGAYDLGAGTVDYNRSGVPLVEIVTAPDMTSPAEARAFLDELRLLLVALRAARPGVATKADANVSLEGGNRVEVKNVNSARNVERALEAEVERHREARGEDENVARQTRHFDEDKGETVALRAKETEADYRYLPDPDLPAAPLPDALVEEHRVEDHPFELRRDVAEAVGVAEEEVDVLLQDPGLLDAQVELMGGLPARRVFHFLERDLRGELDYRDQTFASSPAGIEGLRDLVGALAEDEITEQVATRLLRGWLDGEGLDDRLEGELAAGAGDEAAREAAEAVVEANPEAVEDYRAGKEEALNHLMGQAMGRLQGRAPPDEVRAALVDLLEDGGNA
jgi:aspartyl-tRNA(Asn)/glutamyl-tRNA(Gln) amidotransferase subunit B